MTLGKGKEVVVDILGRPVEPEDVVALAAILGETRFLVVGVGGRLVIVPVAIDAIVPDAVEAKRGFRDMAFEATHGAVCADEGESVFVVQLADVVDQPVVGIVAPGAIRPHGLLVHVRVAGDAVLAGFGENQGLVAAPAIHRQVPARERVIGLGVVEAFYLALQNPTGGIGDRGISGGVQAPGVGDLPARSRMAGGTVGLQFCPVGRLSGQAKRKPDEEYYL